MSKQPKPTTQAERQQAEDILKRMAEEMAVRVLEITIWPDTNSIDIEVPGLANYFYTSLDTAYIHYLHKQAGTEPPPF